MTQRTRTVTVFTCNRCWTEEEQERERVVIVPSWCALTLRRRSFSDANYDLCGECTEALIRFLAATKDPVKSSLQPMET